MSVVGIKHIINDRWNMWNYKDSDEQFLDLIIKYEILYFEQTNVQEYGVSEYTDSIKCFINDFLYIELTAFIIEFIDYKLFVENKGESRIRIINNLLNGLSELASKSINLEYEQVADIIWGRIRHYGCHIQGNANPKKIYYSDNWIGRSIEDVLDAVVEESKSNNLLDNNEFKAIYLDHFIEKVQLLTYITHWFDYEIKGIIKLVDNL